jgi:hypothetical protein
VAATAAALLLAVLAGKALRVTLSGSSHRASVYLTGFENPLAATVSGGRLFVGDWTTGRIYDVAG